MSDHDTDRQPTLLGRVALMLALLWTAGCTFGPTMPSVEGCDPATLIYDTVIINEIIAHTDPPWEDAIELYNPSDQDICIGGWYLTDNDKRPTRYRIPKGAVIAARGFAVFYEQHFNARELGKNGFGLSEHGEEVYLIAADANGNFTGYRDGAKFGATPNGQALGRYVTGNRVKFVPVIRPTFGVENPTSVPEFRHGTGAENAAWLVDPSKVAD